MGSINLTLERMSRQRGLSSVVAAYVYAALLVAGPWIFTVVGLVGLSSASCADPCGSLLTFRSVVIYNSMISLVLTSPLAFLCARYVSDQLFLKRSQSVIYALVAALAVFGAITSVTTVPFYLFTTTLEAPEQIASIQNAVLIGCSWLLIPFLGAVRRHNVVLFAFGAGALALVAAGRQLVDPTALKLLLAFNAGFTIVNAILIGALARQFGAAVIFDAGLLGSLRNMWELPAAGFAYALGLWIDKIIMWFGASEGGLRVAGSLQTMPSYDTPMFWAQLASIPIFAVFFVHVETRFSALFQAFYGRLEQHATLRELTSSMNKLRVFVISNIVSLFVALVIVATMAILLSFVFMNELGLRPTYMGIQRISLCAMVFHTSAMLCFMFLLYFDLRHHALLVVSTHLVLNTALTLAILPAGPAFYGYGNMIASALTFLLAFSLVLREFRWLHYHAFITNNTSL
jgi:polysaccharide biosynthesis protein PelG